MPITHETAPADTVELRHLHGLCNPLTGKTLPQLSAQKAPLLTRRRQLVRIAASRQRRLGYLETQLEKQHRTLSAADSADFRSTEEVLSAELKLQLAYLCGLAPRGPVATVRGGDDTCTYVARHLQAMMNEPVVRTGPSSFQSPSELGWMLIPTVSCSALDGVGADFVLVHSQLGEFLPIDASRRSKLLPPLREIGLIVSDPFDQTLPRLSEVTAFHAARAVIIRQQFQRTLDYFFENGSPLNLFDLSLPDAGEGESLPPKVHETMAAIRQIDHAEGRLAAISQLTEQVKFHQAQTVTFVRDLEALAEELRRQKDRKAELVQQYADHLTANTLNFFERCLTVDLPKLVREANALHHRPATKVPARPARPAATVWSASGLTPRQRNMLEAHRNGHRFGINARSSAVA